MYDLFKNIWVVGCTLHDERDRVEDVQVVTVQTPIQIIIAASGEIV